MSKPRILVMTEIDSVQDAREILDRAGRITVWPKPSYKQVLGAIHRFDAVLTSPNDTKVFLSKEILNKGKKLKAICTISTGTNHIDMGAARKRHIKVLSLATERKLIGKLHSAAELALALTLASVRCLLEAAGSVKKGVWDYHPYVGRQMDRQTIGVIGYGRLGKLYARYALAFGARVLVYLPHRRLRTGKVEQVSLERLLKDSDIVSLHVHLNEKTSEMVDKKWLSQMKKNSILINTSRGQIVDEKALLAHLNKNHAARYAADVICDESGDIRRNILVQASLSNPRILLTPHIGGMTREAREIAYTHSAKQLVGFLRSTTGG